MMNLRHFEVLFKATPAPCLIVMPDAPRFTITEVNDAYCRATRSTRADLLGKGIFEAFPDNADDPSGNGVRNLKSSLEQVVESRAEHRMAIQKYDIPERGSSAFRTRYWSPVNYPVPDENGELLYIMHTVTDVTEQVLTENKERSTRRELIENQEHYRSLFHNNPDAVYSFDLEGYFLSANQKLAEIAECPVERLQTLNFRDFVAPEDQDLVMDNFLRAGKGEIRNFDTAAYTATGRRVIFNVTNLPITVNDQIIGVYGIAKDITARIQADLQLQQREQQLKKIMDFSRDVICIIDQDRIFVKISAACQRLWGYRPEELEGTSYMELIAEMDRREMDDAAEELRKGFNIKHIENRYRHKDGRIITMSWSAYWDKEERLSFCVGRDITEEKAAAEKIRHNERRFQTLLQNSTDGLALLDPTGLMTDVTETGYRILGYGRDEMTSRVRPDLIHPQDLGYVTETFRRVLNDPHLVQSFEYRLLQPAGNYKWIEANFQNQLHEPAVGALVMNFRDITERKKASDRLRSSEDRYRYLFEYNPMPMWVYDVHTYRFLEVNQAATEKYGYTREEFLTMTLEDIRPEEDRQRLRFSASARTGQATRYKDYWRHVKKNREVMYVDITSHRIDYNGSPAILILSQDVTAKVNAADSIRKSEEVRTLIMNSALDAIVCLDTRGMITLWNDQAEKIFGWQRGEVLGKRLSDYIIPDSYREGYESRFRQYMKKGVGEFTNRVVEVTAVDRKGIEFPVELAIVHIRQRETGFFCAYIRDITERQHHLTALDQSEKRYRTLVREGTDLIHIIDEKGNYRFVSPTYQAQLGYSEEDLRGCNAFDLIHEDDRRHVLEAFLRLKTEKRVKTRPYRFRDSSHTYRWLESVGTSLLTDPSIDGILVNSKDITERMDYIRAIEDQNSRLREIAWTQSHVVRAPLSRIIGIVNVMTSYPGVDAQKLLEALLSSAHELDEQVRRIVKSTELMESNPGDQYST